MRGLIGKSAQQHLMLRQHFPIDMEVNQSGVENNNNIAHGPF